MHGGTPRGRGEDGEKTEKGNRGDIGKNEKLRILNYMRIG
jgi:hypothetical protein